MQIRRFDPLVQDYPFLKDQLYAYLDTTASNIDGSDTGLMLRFWTIEADRFLMAMRFREAIEGLPLPPRAIEETVLRKEILYAIDDSHRPTVYTAWNRDASQRLRNIFRDADPVETNHLILIVREQCRRITRKHREVTQLCLHAVIVKPPPCGFAPII